MRHIAVIGGGVAGISAALEAAGRGASVTLYESMPHLGGRAAGVGSLDTGRHLVLSSYHSFLSLLNRLNSLDQIRFAPLQFTVLDKGRSYQLPFRFGPLGGQWAAGLGLMTRSFLSPNQRSSSLAALARTLVSPPIEPDDDTLAGDGIFRRFREVGSATVEDVFHRFEWPSDLIRKLGHPLALGIGNASASQLSGGLFLTALNRVMTDSEPRAGWVVGERYGSVLSEPAAKMLPQRGVKLRLGEGVRWIERLGDGWNVVSTLADCFDRVVVTVPPGRYELLREIPEAQPLMDAGEIMKGRGILTVRTRVYGPVSGHGPITETDPPHAVWFCEWHPEGGVLLERTISNLDNDTRIDLDLTKMAFAQHAFRWFNAKVDEDDVTVRFFPDATMTLSPGVLRPALRQAPGLYYASDISATGLPATLESAARAGLLAGKLAATDS